MEKSAPKTRRRQTNIPKRWYTRTGKPDRISIRTDAETVARLNALALTLKETQSTVIEDALTFAEACYPRFLRHRHTKRALYLKVNSPNHTPAPHTGHQGDFSTLEKGK